MGILDSLMSALGGSGIEAQKNLGLLQQLGMGQGANPATTTDATQGQLNPAFAGATPPSANSTNWGQVGGSLSALGRGLADGGAASRMPVSFGEALGKGAKSMEDYQSNQIGNQLKGAEAYKAVQGDPQQQYTNALQRKFAGTSLPGDDALIQAMNAQNQSKLTYSQDPSGQFIPHPAAADITSMLPGGQTGRTTQVPGSQPSQAPAGAQQPRGGIDPSQLRGYFQYLQQKMGQQQ